MRRASNGLDGDGAVLACVMTAVVLPASAGTAASVEYGEAPMRAIISSRFSSPVVTPRYPCTMGARSCPDSDMALWIRTLPSSLSMTLKSSAFTQIWKPPTSRARTLRSPLTDRKFWWLSSTVN